MISRAPNCNGFTMRRKAIAGQLRAVEVNTLVSYGRMWTAGG